MATSPDEDPEITEAAAIARRGTYSATTGTLRGPQSVPKCLGEVEVARLVVCRMGLQGSIRYTSEPNGRDKAPDVELEISDRASIWIEVTELLDEQRRREYAIQLASLKQQGKFEYEEVRSGRIAPIEPTIWSKPDFIQKIQDIISSKDRKVPAKPDRISASMLAIFTDDTLAFGISEIEMHKSFTSDKFDKVFLILGYDPSLAIKDIPEAPDGYLTIELKLS